MEEKKEEDPTVYDHLGDVLIKMNDINSAKENYEKAEVLFKEKSEKEKIKEKIKTIEKIKWKNSVYLYYDRTSRRLI